MTPHRSTRFHRRTFLGRLTEDELHIVLAEAPTTRLGKGTLPVLTQNVSSSVLVGVLSGFVKALCAATPDATPRLLDVYGPGDLLGLDDFVLGFPSHLTVLPLSKNVETVSISCARFTEVMTIHQKIAGLVRHMCATNSRERDELAAHLSLDIPDRVDAFLTHLSRKYGTKKGGGWILEIPLQKKDIADALCISTESVRTALRELRGRRRLRYGPDHYYLADSPPVKLDVNFPAGPHTAAPGALGQHRAGQNAALGDTDGPQW